MKTAADLDAEAALWATGGSVTPIRPDVAVNHSDVPESFSAPERARVWRAKELQAAAQPKWLAQNRIPRSAISLLVGAEGIGKSLAWVLIAAAVTTGRAVPGFGIPNRSPEHIFAIVTEDDWSSTVLPRLEVAGADLDFVSVICTERDGSGAPTFPNDLHLITGSQLRPALIVVDAWLDTVPGGLSVKDPQQARRALHPWKEAATATGAAVLLLTHTNRVQTGNARDKYGATGELRKKARMALYAQADPDHDGQLLIGPEKSNTAGRVPATQFRIDPIQYFEPSDDDGGTVPRLALVGDSKMTMREHIAEASDDGQDGEDREEKNGAQVFLRDYLEVEGPRAKSAEAKRAASAVGISPRTLARARTALKVVIDYEGHPATTVWSLPVAPSTGTPSDS